MKILKKSKIFKKVLTNERGRCIIVPHCGIVFVFLMENVLLEGKIMKMEKTNVEFVEFDAKDVITTSTPVPDFDFIWLSSASIDNYNAIAAGISGHSPLNKSNYAEMFGGGTAFDYYSFNGLHITEGSGKTYWASAAGRNDPNAPTAADGLFVVGENDTSMYTGILNWLTAHLR